MAHRSYGWRLMQPGSIVRPLSCLALVCAVGMFAGPSRAVEPVSIAVLEFDYVNPAGGIMDQGGADAERLQRLVQRVREGLAESGRYQVIPLSCDPSPCSAGRVDPDVLLTKARAAGARLLVFGGVQKMGPVIQYGNAEAVDLLADRLIFDRNVVLRNDSQEAWDYAAKHLVSELVKQKLAQTEASTR